MSEIVARVIRNNLEESIHRGHIAVVNADGGLMASVGDPAYPTFIRSAAKPFQIMPLLLDEAVQYYQFADQELAVMISSHNGEEIHINTVLRILEKIGLTEGHLKCGLHPPMHETTAAKLLTQNMELTPVYNNCSGKHSGMLALASYHGWRLETYLQSHHPVQMQIKQKISLFSGLDEKNIGVGVDGCSAPVFYLPIKNMALMYAKLAEGKIEPAKRVFDLMSSHPEMIAGSDRFDTDLMKVMGDRMISKVGAEGIRCLAVRGGPPLGIAVKIEDGDKRASPPVMLEVLKQLNLISKKEIKELSKYRKPVFLNHAGIETGWISAEFVLQTKSGGILPLR
ncbi:MAG: asparaginase [bacterium]